MQMFSVSRTTDTYRNRIISEQYSRKFTVHATKAHKQSHAGIHHKLQHPRRLQKSPPKHPRGDFCDELQPSSVVRKLGFIKGVVISLTSISFANVPIKPSDLQQVLLIIPYH